MVSSGKDKQKDLDDLDENLMKISETFHENSQEIHAPAD